MGNIDVVVNRQTRMIQQISKKVIGNDGENLQENLVFSFDDEFVDGQARLEIQMPDKVKNFINLAKVDETYQTPVKNVITKTGKIYMQLVIDEGTDANNVPIFKSNTFYVVVNSSLNAVEEAPDGYAQWIEIANAKINEIDATIADLNQKVESGYFDGADGQDGRDGVDGKDAKINGYNILEIVAGNNIIITQEGNQLIISAKALYPDNILQTSDGDIFMTSDDAYFVLKESD